MGKQADYLTKFKEMIREHYMGRAYRLFQKYPDLVEKLPSHDILWAYSGFLIKEMKEEAKEFATEAIKRNKERIEDIEGILKTTQRLHHLLDKGKLVDALLDEDKKR